VRVPAVVFALALALVGGATPAAANSATPDARLVHPVGVRSATFTDSSRATPEVPVLGLTGSPTRVLPVTVWYPARGATTAMPTPDARPATGRFPLIVWAHGNSARGSAPPPVVPMWASYGYVVVAPDFPVSSRARTILDATADWGAQPADVRFVLDRMLSPGTDDPLRAHVDRRHVGLAGHSLGAITVLAEAYGPDPDARVGAVISLSGIPLLPGTDVASRPTPLLLIHADNDATVPYGSSTDMFAAASGPHALVTVVGGNHSTFLYSAGPETAKVVATATLAFWDRYLRGDRAAPDRITALATPGSYEVQASWAPPTPSP